MNAFLNQNLLIYLSYFNYLNYITSICSSGNNTYFLTINGNIYFCGLYYDENQIECYQMVPKLLTNDVKINSLHSIVCYQQKDSNWMCIK